VLLSTRDLDILSSLSEMFFTSFFVAGVAILLLDSIRAHSFDIYNKSTNLLWTYSNRMCANELGLSIRNSEIL